MSKRAERRTHAERIVKRREKDMRDVGSPEFNEANPTHKYASTHPLSCNCDMCSSPSTPPRKKYTEED